jgi:hypothetical protein
MSDRLETNRAMWEERVPIHVDSDFYDVERFLAGATTLRPFEIEELPEPCSPAGRSSSASRDIYRLPQGMPSMPLMYSRRATLDG